MREKKGREIIMEKSRRILSHSVKVFSYAVLFAIFFLSFQNHKRTSKKIKNQINERMVVKVKNGQLIIGDVAGRVGIFFDQGDYVAKGPSDFRQSLDSMVVFNGRGVGSAGFSFRGKLIGQTNQRFSEIALRSSSLNNPKEKGWNIGMRVDDSTSSLGIQQGLSNSRILNHFLMVTQNHGTVLQITEKSQKVRLSVDEDRANMDLVSGEKINGRKILRFGASHYLYLWAFRMKVKGNMDGFGLRLGSGINGLFKLILDPKLGGSLKRIFSKELVEGRRK